MTDPEALARLSLDEPLDRGEREALRIWGDALEWAGDPRGTLIALEHALHTHPGRRRDLDLAMTQHVLANARTLLGALAPVVEFRRAVALDFRSGFLRSAFIDTRYVAAGMSLAPARLVALLLGAPTTATLRRLHVRVRTVGHVEPVMAMLRNVAGPLEEILVQPGVRPTTIARRAPPPPHAQTLAAACPGLRLLVDDRGVVELPLALPAGPPARTIGPLLAHSDPSRLEGRVALGRALVHHNREVRAVALERIRELGPSAFMFLDTLMMMLQPGIVAPQAPIAACVAALGEHARLALPLLATVTGRAGHYDAETRRAAGLAIAALSQ